MTEAKLYTMHQHKDTGIRVRLISTEAHHCYLRGRHWVWFGTHQEFAAQFRPILVHHPPTPYQEPPHDQKKPLP